MKRILAAKVLAAFLVVPCSAAIAANAAPRARAGLDRSHQPEGADYRTTGTHGTHGDPDAAHRHHHGVGGSQRRPAARERRGARGDTAGRTAPVPADDQSLRSRGDDTGNAGVAADLAELRQLLQSAAAASKAAEAFAATKGNEPLRAASRKLRASCDACHVLYLRKYESPKVLESDYKFDFDSALRRK